MLPPERPSAWPLSAGPKTTALPRGPRRRGSRLTRWIPLVLALTAVGAFGSIVVYAYYLVDRKATDGIAPLIKAENRPLKIRPDKPGGLDVPHQDKEIYNRLGAGSDPSPRGQRVERLLPPPETPLPRPASAPPILEPPIPPSPDLEPPAGAVVVTLPPSSEPLPKPTGGNVPPGAQPAPAAKPPPVQPQAAPPPTPPARPNGKFRIQIAAVQSAEAAAGEWNRLKRAHADLLGSLSSNVLRVDRGDGTAMFRIQAGPLPDAAAADDLCNKLKARKLTCFVVRPQ